MVFFADEEDEETVEILGTTKEFTQTEGAKSRREFSELFREKPRAGAAAIALATNAPRNCKHVSFDKVRLEI